jgi:CubicO group peptidase (beta-lactamase class C family)
MTETMNIIRKVPLEFAPGTRHRYGNNGYDTLGAIVAAVSGQSFYDYVREHVFAAAGMTRTDFYTRPRWLTDRRIAHPYLLDCSSVPAAATASRPPGTWPGSHRHS